jgi:dTDP-4-amino-4,6-dideoxygalactose transaminase
VREEVVVEVPLLDMGAMYRPQEGALRAAMDRVLASQHFILGPEVSAFEEALAAWVGEGVYAVSCSSGSAALLLALMAAGIGPGDEVVVPTYSFFATAGCVARLGARPVWVDVEPGSYNLDPSKLGAALTERTRAVIPVHLFGRAADVRGVEAALEAAGRREQVVIIEDAAQSLGARHWGRPVGSLAPLCCLSFFPSKNLGAFGDAGAVLTTDGALAERLMTLRAHGARTKYHHELLGINSRLDALQAAILRVRLEALDGWLEARRANAASYRALFAEAGLEGVVELPPEDGAEGAYWHTYNQFNLMVERRDALQGWLKRAGIGTAIYYPEPLHVQPCFADTGAVVGDAPVSERACERALAIPVYPGMEEAQRRYVVAEIARFYEGAGA